MIPTLGHGHNFLHMDELTKCASGTQSTRQHQTLRKWQLCQSPECKSIWGNSLVEDALVLKFRPLHTISSPRLPLFLQSTPHPFPLPPQERLKKINGIFFACIPEMLMVAAAFAAPKVLLCLLVARQVNRPGRVTYTCSLESTTLSLTLSAIDPAET